MNVSLILAHPNQGSFNHAIAIAAINALEAKGHRISFHDLYRERFDPVLPYEEIPKGADLDPTIEKHCQEIASADGIIIVHPNWWGMPPAILKGWVDRVIRPGIAYEFLEGDGGEGVPGGLLKARKALVFNTSNTFSDREEKAFGDPLQTLWKNCIFGLCGVEEFYRKTYCVIVTSTPEERTAWLEDVEDTVARFFPEDEMGQRILALLGSPRKGGNTDILADEILRGARAQGPQGIQGLFTQKLRLYDYEILPCTDCCGCKNRERGL